MEANWLIYFQINKNEGRHLQKTIDLMCSNMNRNVTAFVMHFGPSTASDAKLIMYRSNERRLLLRYRNKGIEDVVGNLKKFSEYIIKSKTRVDAVCIWAHGAGYGISKWKGWKRPFLQLDDAVRHIITPFKPSLVCFDACFQGNMSCLYEMPLEVRVVMASPAFHPFVSLMWTKTFGKLSAGMNKSEIQRYARKMCEQWHQMTRAKWKCMLVFDMNYVPIIAEMVRKEWDSLIFDRVSQIDREDANLHDLFAAARNVPNLQMMVLQSVRDSGKCCLEQCTTRVRGMSIEAHLPRKWLTAYTSTRWYKNIVRNKRGFRDSRLRNLLLQGKV